MIFQDACIRHWLGLPLYPPREDDQHEDQQYCHRQCSSNHGKWHSEILYFRFVAHLIRFFKCLVLKAYTQRLDVFSFNTLVGQYAYAQAIQTLTLTIVPGHYIRSLSTVRKIKNDFSQYDFHRSVFILITQFTECEMRTEAVYVTLRGAWVIDAVIKLF